MNALGEKLRRLRKAQGLTQGELAEKVGVGINTIVRYETGKNSPKAEILELITKELGAKIVVVPEKELGGE
jgi:transcriptional regulator with XRE-family HTH domain